MLLKSVCSPVSQEAEASLMSQLAAQCPVQTELCCFWTQTGFGELHIKKPQQQKLKYNQNHQCSLLLQDLNPLQLWLNMAQTIHEVTRADEA